MSEQPPSSPTTRWPRLDPSRWPLILWRHPVLILLAFALGGLTSFAYSYAPLHSANDWQISYLEQRLSSRNQQAREIEKELEEARDALSDVPPAEALSALESRLDEATDLAEARGREIKKLKTKLERSERSLRSEQKAAKRRERQHAEELAAAESAEALDSFPAGDDANAQSNRPASRTGDSSHPASGAGHFPASAGRSGNTVPEVPASAGDPPVDRSSELDRGSTS